MIAYLNGKYVMTSVTALMFRASTDFNNFQIGKPNSANGYYGEAAIDELLFWDDVKSEGFMEQLFNYYASYKLLFSNAGASFKILGNVTLYNIAPIMECMPTADDIIHPCRLQCMWFTWCGAVVQTNHNMCRYYNVFYIDALTVPMNGYNLFIKQID